MISSPSTSWSMLRNGWVWVTRCPAKTALPNWPGMALPGQWPGPWSMTVSVTPSKTGWTRPILGIRISPTWTIGLGALALLGGAMGLARGAAAGWPAGEAAVIVVASGTVVVVDESDDVTRVGASRA